MNICTEVTCRPLGDPAIAKAIGEELSVRVDFCQVCGSPLVLLMEC